MVLPEMWNCPYSNDSFPTYAEDVDAGESPSAAMLAAAAADNRVVLVRWAGQRGVASAGIVAGSVQPASCPIACHSPLPHCCALPGPIPCLQVGGSIPERANGGRLYNTCLVYGRDGRLLGRHRKVGLHFQVTPFGGHACL